MLHKIKKKKHAKRNLLLTEAYKTFRLYFFLSVEPNVNLNQQFTYHKALNWILSCYLTNCVFVLIRIKKTIMKLEKLTYVPL